MNKQHLRRPRIHRAFVKWLKKNSTRFAVPLRMTKIKGEFRFYFENYPDCFFVQIFRHNLAAYDLAVYVEWQGRLFDILLLEGTDPIVTRGGYEYSPNMMRGMDWYDPSPVFPSLEAMLQNDLFEPLLRWVNDRLAPARGLQIVRVKGFWEARLFRDELELPADGKPYFVGDPEGCFEFRVPLKPHINPKDES